MVEHGHGVRSEVNHGDGQFGVECMCGWKTYGLPSLDRAYERFAAHVERSTSERSQDA